MTELARATQLSGTFSHRLNADTEAKILGQADAAVDEVDQEVPLGNGNGYLRAVHRRMASDIGEYLGNNPVGRHLDRRRKSGWRLSGDRDFKREVFGGDFNGADQPQLVEHRRAKTTDEPSDVVEGAPYIRLR